MTDTLSLYFHACDHCKVINGAPYHSSTKDLAEKLLSAWNTNKEKCKHCEIGGQWRLLICPTSDPDDVHGADAYKTHLAKQGWLRK